MTVFRLIITLLATSILGATEGVVTSNSVRLTDGETLASAMDKGALALNMGDVTFIAGYRQVTSIRQDPIIMRFDGQGSDAVKTWQRTDIDATAVDSRAVGLIWDGYERLYVLITVDGGSNDAGTVRRFTNNGWLRDYGSGGGPKVTVALRVDPNTGTPDTGTYIRARLSNGNTNSAVPTAIAFHGDTLVVQLSSFFSPLRVDRQRMTHDTGPSPFPWRVVFDPSLANARRSEAVNFDGVVDIPELPSRQVRLMVGDHEDASATVIVNQTVVARPSGSILDSGIYDPAAPCSFQLHDSIPSSLQ
ncbi:MAG: hypothetical protein EA401_02155 [Planctomycetota bacterium]|nr:MAG: hypothetical protein EA401_02155 [Planctomycetota bacterium]